MGRELEEKTGLVQHYHRNTQKLTMEKFSLESENRQLREKLTRLETNLSEINEDYLPRLQEAEKLHSELEKEVKSIRADAELLPGMFRNEALMKQKIKEEQLTTEQKMACAIKQLAEQRERSEQLAEQLGRKGKIALQAIAARNTLEKALRAAKALSQDLSSKLEDQSSFQRQMREEVQKHQMRHEALQAHVYSQNNRINELEEQKKVLMQQLRDSGNHSKAHFTYKLLKQRVS